ncbi:flavin reductase family protein [Jatrophihabitans fulvus]
MTDTTTRTADRLAAVGDQAHLRSAFARFPSGVLAVCALDGTTPVGMAASSFVPVSLEPPLVSFCAALTSRTWTTLRTLPRLGLSVLADSHEAASRALSRREGDRFGELTWSADDGAVFIDSAALWLDCSLEEEMPAGDHVIAVMRVHRLAFDPQVDPLVFHGSRYRRLWDGDPALG